MTAKMIKIGVSIAAVALLSVVNVKAGGSVDYYWNNAAEVNAAQGAPFYGADGTTRLAIGDLVQLVAFQGATNFVLGAGTIGQDSTQLTSDQGNGWINTLAGHESTLSTVLSNAAAGTFNSPLGIRFYTGTTVQNSQFFGTVENLSIVGQTPNWATPPAGATIVEVDYTDAAWLGIRTADLNTLNSESNDNGFIANTANPDYVVPEPSTLVLVGMGLFGAIGMIRRRRNG